MYLRRSCCLLLALLLVGCKVEESTLPVTESGANLHDSQAPEAVQTDTGSLLPKEVLLPGGIVSIGEEAAPVTLIVFTEHHCRYCREFHEEHLLRLSSEFIDPGLLQVQLVPFPLRKYEHSATAAMAALCAGQQGRGLDMHSALFQAETTSPKQVKALATELELNASTFASCLDDDAREALLQEQYSWAETWGIDLVPSFVLNGEKFVGLPYYSDLRGKIEQQLVK